MGLIHTKIDCIKNGKWIDGEFRCKKCGRMIAMAYKFEDDIRIFKLPKYKGKNVKFDLKSISYINENKIMEGEANVV